ncbi:hypothetical protein Gotur_011411 [Gossypium turneri]
MHLQLQLPVDRLVITGSIQSGNWRGVCGELLDSVVKRFMEVGSK